jgi:WD40 repeat protein
MDVAQIKQVEGHSADINDAWYSPNAAMLATASDDETVKIWNTDATPTPQMTDGVGLLPDAHAAAYQQCILAVMASKWRKVIVCRI